MKRHAAAALVLAVGATVGAVQGAPPTAAQTAPNLVIGWNETLATAALASGIAPGPDPLHESRMYAMVHIAIHDALNAIDRRSEPYAVDLGEHPDASVEAAVAVAAYKVAVPVLEELRALPAVLAINVDAARAVVQEAYDDAIGDVAAGPAKDEGMAIGEDAAAAILDDRTGDGSDTEFLDFGYEEGDQPGEYRFIPGAPFAAAPGWGEVTPFLFDDIESIRPHRPHDLASRQYAKDFDELKRLGGDDEGTPSDRTDDETEIAMFWFESSPLMWNRIARTVSVPEGLDAWDTARLFALLNMALADGYVANWDVKYLYNRWRPQTAIFFGDDDTNRWTDGDESWRPLVPNGATPEYDSGHSIEGAAAAEVMRRVLGTDRVTFSACSYTLPERSCTHADPITRDFKRLSDAAAENGWSRILVGWHFRNAVETGLKRGQRIGAEAVREFLQPVR